jgi:hypothetical protein
MHRFLALHIQVDFLASILFQQLRDSGVRYGVADDVEVLVFAFGGLEEGGYEEGCEIV